MRTLMPRHHLATLAAVAGVLVAAAPASAAQPPKTIAAMPDVCILYNGHAGLGAN
jgi:hypothetical protein